MHVPANLSEPFRDDVHPVSRGPAADRRVRALRHLFRSTHRQVRHVSR